MAHRPDLAQIADADRIAEIAIAAFRSNLMFRTLFPTQAIQDELRTCIAENTVTDIGDLNITIHVTRDGGEVVAFAKWFGPAWKTKTNFFAEPVGRWPEGTNWLALEQWTEICKALLEEAIGKLPYMSEPSRTGY